MAESKKGHSLVNISRNSLRSLSGYLKINPKSYATYQYPSSSGFQYRVDKVFIIAIMAESKKGHNLVNFLLNSLKS